MLGSAVHAGGGTELPVTSHVPPEHAHSTRTPRESSSDGGVRPRHDGTTAAMTNARPTRARTPAIYPTAPFGRAP